MIREAIRESFSGKQGGIRRRLLIWGLALLGSALALNTLAGSFYTYLLIERDANALQVEIASRLSKEMDSFVQSKLDRLLDFSALVALQKFGGQEQRLMGLLLLKNDHFFTELTLMDQDGVERLKISERKVYLPSELSEDSDSMKFRIAMAGETYVSPVYTSERAEPYVSVAVPIKRSPRDVMGVAVAELNLKSLWEIIGSIKFGEAGYAYLVDSTGRLIAHRDPSTVLKNQSLIHLPAVQRFLRNPSARNAEPLQEVTGLGGQAVLSTYAPVPRVGWAVVLEEPVDLALAELHRMVRNALLLMGLGLVAGALAIVWVSHKIAGPIQRLHEGVSVVGKGDLDHRVEIKSGDEIEELAEEFNRMAEELKNSHSTLEQRVEQRTKELSALYTVASAVNHSFELEPLLRKVIREINQLFDFDAARIFLFNPRMDELRIAASYETHPELWTQVRAFKRGQGVVGRVAETGEPMIFEDVHNDPLYRQLSQSQANQNAGCNFFGVFPIKSKERPVGVAALIGKSPRKLTADEQRLLISMTEQIGVAVERASLLRETVRRARELSALYDVTATVNQSMDPDVILKAVIRKVLEVTGFDAARIYLLDPQGERLMLRAYEGISTEYAIKAMTYDLRGVNGHVAKTGKSMVFEDIHTDPEYARMARSKVSQQAGFHAYIALPLRSKTKILGIMNFLSRQVREVSPGEISLLTSMADQISIAIENSTLFEETLKRERHISVLHRVATKVSQFLDLGVVLREAIDKLLEILPFEGARIFLLDASGAVLHLRAYKGVGSELIRGTSYQPGEGMAGKVIESGKPLVFEDIQIDPLYEKYTRTRKMVSAGLRTLAFFPIRVKDKNLGVLSLSSYAPHHFSPDELQLLDLVAGEIGVAVENARLYEEARQKSVELEELNQELEEANRTKADFLAAMSHELRTPLNVIIGNADLMKEEVFGEVTEKQQESLRKIIHYSDVLLKLINDVLTLTKMEAKRVTLHLSTFHVEDIIGHAQSYVEQLNRGNRLKISWKVGKNLPPLTTDALKLEEILQNLIGNAFKFTPKGGVEIRVRDLRKEGRIEFAVADTGIGIDDKDLPHIFEQFHQLGDAHTGDYSGVGLGLNIVKKYLNMMRGEIRVASKPGDGSTFTFSLPYSVSPN